jgi:DNA-binding ferritin-like protein (Dps family)
MNKIIDTLFGDMDEKKAYRENEKRAKKLPAEYYDAYKDIKAYIFRTSGILTIDPLKVLVDLLEEAAADGRRVVDITGPDVATFADELVKGEKSYFDNERQKLNKNFSKLDKKGE